MPQHSPDPHIFRQNATAFLWFRVCFNARLYYPIFIILFLDLGLTMAQFTVLNALWAASIVLFEVPSGALADRLGRKKLVVFSAILMMVEMAILFLIPSGGGTFAFSLFALNRVISGLAEACCSGADEALVYDALPPAEREAAWTRLLSKLMRWQSISAMIAFVVGAHLYDTGFMNWIAGLLHHPNFFTHEITMRLPLVVNFGLAIVTFMVSLRFVEARTAKPHATPDSTRQLIAGSVKHMWDTACWIAKKPAAVVLIGTGLLFDCFIRLFYSIGSDYYRLIGITKESYYGIIAVCGSLLGFAIAILVEKMVRNIKPSANMAWVGGLILIGLIGISLNIRYWGVLFAVPFWVALRSLHYFLSQYLNKIADSSHRATVLSFKGLSINLAYGAIMLLFGLQSTLTDQAKYGPEAQAPDQARHQAVLAACIQWWPLVFAAIALAWIITVRIKYRANLTTLMEKEAATP